MSIRPSRLNFRVNSVWAIRGRDGAPSHPVTGGSHVYLPIRQSRSPSFLLPSSLTLLGFLLVLLTHDNHTKMGTNTVNPILATSQLLLALFFFFSLARCDSPVTINENAAYSSQRVCAFPCFEAFDDIGYPIAQEISCATFKVMNDCFCRTDIQQQAHSYVSSCVNLRCSNNAKDISTATSLYDGYCTSNGYIAEVQATTTAQDSGAFTVYITEKPTIASATVTVTQTVMKTATSAAQSLVYSVNMLCPVAALGLTSLFTRAGLW